MFEHYDDILDVYTVAIMLCVGRNRIYELLDSGELKGIRIGRVWKIPKEAVEEFIRTGSGLK